MKKKKSIIITVIAAVLLVVLFVTLVMIPAIKKGEINAAKKDLYKNYYTFPESGVITAVNGFGSTKENTLIYVKSAERSTADCVEVDVVFDDEGVPYIAKKKKDIDSSTMPLEYLISRFSDEQALETDETKIRRHHINIHIVDADNISVIEELAVKYNMTDYVFLTGVNKNQSVYVSSKLNIIGFYLDYDLDKTKINDRNYIDEVFNDITTSGAMGINTSVDGFGEKLKEVLNENWLKVSLKDVNDELDMCKALKFSPNQIITDNPELLRNILYEWNANAPASDIITP